jgi:hypothetical protein
VKDGRGQDGKSSAHFLGTWFSHTALSTASERLKGVNDRTGRTPSAL